MAGRDEKQQRTGLGRREQFVWQAAVGALSVHVVVLLAASMWGGLPGGHRTAYAEIEFADFALPEQTQTMEEAVRERMESRMDAVRNAAADVRADRSDDIRSSRAESERMAEEVEAELRAFEQSAFDELAEGRGNGEVPDPRDNRQDRGSVDDRYEGWDARYDGQVTAEFDLDGRRALGLDIPGYRCRGGGVVVVTIGVAPGGEVISAVVSAVTTTGGEGMSECLSEESLRSARRCRFQSLAGAPKRQEGTLTYRFIAQ